jgi:hypothetical protein
MKSGQSQAKWKLIEVSGPPEREHKVVATGTFAQIKQKEEEYRRRNREVYMQQ